MRSGEISADLRSARRSAISASASASASPAPLESKAPAGLVGLGEIGKKEQEWLRGGAPGQKGDARTVGLHTHAARSTQQTRCDAALLGLGRGSSLRS